MTLCIVYIQCASMYHNMHYFPSRESSHAKSGKRMPPSLCSLSKDIFALFSPYGEKCPLHPGIFSPQFLPHLLAEVSVGLWQTQPFLQKGLTHLEQTRHIFDVTLHLWRSGLIREGRGT